MEKDRRIMELQQEIVKLREDLAVSNIDTNKASVMALTRVSFMNTKLDLGEASPKPMC